jgi:PKD domain
MRARVRTASVLLLLLSPGCKKESPAAPSLVLTCSATPASGPAPLAVSFALSVAGAQGGFSVVISYGDGATGGDASARHVYVAPGGYTATFTVSTATQSALCSAPVLVEAPPIPSPTPASSPAPNQQPSAVFRTTPEPDAGNTFTSSPPLTIAFSMCASLDPDGDPLDFTMDFEGDGIIDVHGTTGADCRRSYTYTASGTYVPEMCVTDLLPSLAPAHKYQCKDYVVKITP